jgi:hypothetical protein
MARPHLGTPPHFPSKSKLPFPGILGGPRAFRFYCLVNGVLVHVPRYSVGHIIMPMRRLRLAAVGIAMVGLACQPSLGQSEGGSICVAPLPRDTPATSAPGLGCPSNHFSLRIDHEQRVAWPNAEPLKIEGLDPAIRHSVTVYCEGKSQQRFTFRFSEFKSRELCLFLNDLYKTVQLWDPKQTPAPWCRCKK